MTHLSRIRTRNFIPLAVLALALVSVLAVTPGQRHEVQAATSITGLHVQGNQILNGSGQVVRLIGVDRSGTEYACIQGWGLFDGPNDAASVQAIAAWHTNAVRVPLNEDCWLNINGVNSAYGGLNYQNAIINYVNLLNQNGLVAILDLHWTAPGATQATGQQPMPDQDHSPAFWQSVATTFKGNSSVIFDLFNEPYPDNNQDTTAAWTCWKNGGTCSGMSYQAAGMQELVTTVRNTGATNIIMAGGVQYAGTLTQWLNSSYRLSDPTGNLAASWHNYNFGGCTTSTCWNNQALPVLQQVPLIAGEIGENDCNHTYIDPLMQWMDSDGVSYLGWTWDTWNCSSGPALITDYSGTPTQTFGQGFHDHLAALAVVTPTTGPTATRTPVTTPTAVPTQAPIPTNTPIPPLSAPQNLTAAGAGGKKGSGIKLTWQAPASNGGSAITGYRIYRGTSSGTETLLASVGVQLSYSDKATTSGQVYYYRVSALNPGEGPLSSEAHATAR